MVKITKRVVETAKTGTKDYVIWDELRRRIQVWRWLVVLEERSD
jgi:hypothetical protein|tara:strand:- start:9222 stop:9353 length:132 start_codon:yes stop_codon:yes gene_type:complete